MNVRAFRRLTTITVLALTSVATVAACSSAGPSRPDQMRSTTPSTTPSAGAASTPTWPTADPTRRPTTGPPCLGAVIYTLDASDTGKPWPNLCITVGGALWVRNLGPQGFSLSPPGKVDCWYEAAVRNCRLIDTGTVKVTINNGHQIRQLTLVIAEAASPPLPAPACLRTGTVHRVDASDGGPPWGAMCMKLGAVLRFENLGPGLLSANPQ